MAPVFGLSNFGRRLVETVVSLFAVLGFVYVPLGRHTGLEHAQAVFSTPAAAAAIEDLTATALRLRQRAVAFVTGSPPETMTGSVPPAPAAAPRVHAPGREPRPVPPPLK